MNTMSINYNGVTVEIGTIIGEVARNYSSDFVQRFYVDTDETRYAKVLDDGRAVMFNGMGVDEAGFDVPELSKALGFVGMVIEIMKYEYDENDDEIGSYHAVLPELEEMNLSELKELVEDGSITDVRNWVAKFDCKQIED